MPSIEVQSTEVSLTPVEANTFDVTVSAPNPVVQIVGEGPQGPQGPAGPQGDPGVVAADAPVTYDAGSQTVGLDAAGYVASVNGSVGTVVLDAADVGAYADTNPSGFVDAAGAAAAAPVQSVNGAQGTVVLTTSNVAEGTALYFTDGRASAAAPVQSVNALVGTVVLDAAAVGAYPDSNPSNYIDAAGAPVQSVNGSVGTVVLDAAAVGALGTAATTDVITEGTTNLYNRLPSGGSAGEVLVKASGTAYDAAWGTVFLQSSGMEPARYEHIPGVRSTEVMTDGRLFVAPMFFASSVTVDRIGVRVLTAGTSGSVIRLGIYGATATMFPGTLILDAGTVDATTTGSKEITISQSLPAGVYWLAAVGQGDPATAPVVAARTGNVVPSFSESSNPDQTSQGGLIQLSGVTGALASSYSFTFGSGNAERPAVFLRIAS